MTKDSISVTHVLAALSAVSLCQYHLNESDFAAQAPGSGQKRDQRDICTCSRALGGAQRDPNGWMDRSSNAPRVSNGLAVLLCNAPLSDGAKVYFRSVIRFNPAAHFSRAYGCPWWLTVATEGVLRGRLGGRQCQHASHSLVTLRVTMSATGHWIHTSVTACTWSRVLDIRRSYRGGLILHLG